MLLVELSKLVLNRSQLSTPTSKVQSNGQIISHFQGELDKDTPCPPFFSSWQLSYWHVKSDKTKGPKNKSIFI